MRKNKVVLLITSLLLTAAILCSCAVDLSFLYEDEAPKTLKVHFLDIGQGDSIFIELPNDETMLIDAGEDYYGRGIIDYIEGTGHTKIDYLIGTHPHSDHIGSMGYIVRNFEVGEVYMPKVSADTKMYENLLKSIKSRKLKVKNGKAGVSILNTEDCNAYIIAPVKIDEENLNNCSIVMKLTYKNTSFLFTGDAETGELATIKADMQADVLKVGHHGSRTSTTQELLTKIQPKYAVISCGKNNDYGHPHQEVLKYLKNAGCTVYRTDKQKTVTVISDGENYEVQTKNRSIVRESV